MHRDFARGACLCFHGIFAMIVNDKTTVENRPAGSTDRLVTPERDRP